MAVPQTATEYYESLSSHTPISEKFKDIDNAQNFLHFQQMLVDKATRNFVLDFGDEDAWCGFNLTENDFVALIDGQVRCR
jgi:hypothetical protein